MDERRDAAASLTARPGAEESPRPSKQRAGSLRARKRAETHVALVEAALELFTAGGFDGATMEDVAAAAGVAPRTAYRYFATKEQLVVGDCEAEIDRWCAAFHAVPAEVPLLEALRRATRVVVEEYFQREGFWDRVWWLTTTEPGLAGRSRQATAWLQARAAEAITARLGEDADDPRAQAAAAGAMAALGQALRRWYEHDKALDLAAAVDEAFQRLNELDAVLTAPGATSAGAPAATDSGPVTT